MKALDDNHQDQQIQEEGAMNIKSENSEKLSEEKDEEIYETMTITFQPNSNPLKRLSIGNLPQGPIKRVKQEN